MTCMGRLHVHPSCSSRKLSQHARNLLLQAHPKRQEWRQTTADASAAVATLKAQRAAKHSDAVVAALTYVRENDFAGMQLLIKQKVRPWRWHSMLFCCIRAGARCTCIRAGA